MIKTMQPIKPWWWSSHTCMRVTRSLAMMSLRHIQPEAASPWKESKASGAVILVKLLLPSRRERCHLIAGTHWGTVGSLLTGSTSLPG